MPAECSTVDAPALNENPLVKVRVLLPAKKPSVTCADYDFSCTVFTDSLLIPNSLFQMADSSDALFPLCKRPIYTSESSVMAMKEATAINEASKTRDASIPVQAGNQVLFASRKTFTNKIYLSKVENDRRRALSEKMNAEKVVLRSRTPSFNFQECCFFCATRINVNMNHRKGQEWQKVRTKD